MMNLESIIAKTKSNLHIKLMKIRRNRTATVDSLFYNDDILIFPMVSS